MGAICIPTGCEMSPGSMGAEINWLLENIDVTFSSGEISSR